MTAQPDMSGFGKRPAAPTGFRKFAPYVATAAGGGAAVLIGLYAAQLVLPQHMKPGYVAGTMAGSEAVGHLDTSGDAQISYDVRSQGATNAVQVSTQAMTGASDLANGADLACGLSRMGAQVAAKQRPVWDTHNSTAEWWYELLRDVGDATCGVGGEVRSAMTQELAVTARQSSILSARNPEAVPQVLKPTVVASHHYTPEESGRLAVVALSIPEDVRADLIKDSGTSTGDKWDAFLDRVVAYTAAHPKS